MIEYKIIESNGEYALQRKRKYLPKDYYNWNANSFYNNQPLYSDVYWHKDKKILEKIIKRLEAK